MFSKFQLIGKKFIPTDRHQFYIGGLLIIVTKSEILYSHYLIKKMKVNVFKFSLIYNFI
jgi:hypothetical protein